MANSLIWICQDKKKNVFMFQFNNKGLDRVLRLKGRSSKPGDSPLFDQCSPDIYKDIEGYFEKQTVHKVFYKDVDPNIKGPNIKG